MGFRSQCAVAGILLWSMPGGFAARAADVGNSSSLEEIVVTAQKRAGSVQDPPFSISATSEQQIRNSGASTITDFARNVAGLTIDDLGPGQSQMAIRGISSGQVIRDQPGVKEQVGVYVDESPISIALFTPDLELFDLDRIEVPRGPQGTLFGAGSAAGTVRYITTQPKLGDSKPLRMRRSNGQKAAAAASADRIRRRAGEHRDFIRCATPRLFARQSTSGYQERSLGGGGLSQQSLGHERSPRARLRAWTQRARGLSHEPVAHDRGRRTVQVLT